MALTLRLTSATPSCSEHDLIVAARRGDDRAFEELYSRYRGRITTYILGLVEVEMAIDALGVRSLRSFGVRERRQLARHLAHCEPCRRMAKMAGFDESIFKPRSIA